MVEREVEGPGKGWLSHYQIFQYSWKLFVATSWVPNFCNKFSKHIGKFGHVTTSLGQGLFVRECFGLTYSRRTACNFHAFADFLKSSIVSHDSSRPCVRFSRRHDQMNQPDSQGLHLRYPRYGEDPDTGWSCGTQILGA